MTKALARKVRLSMALFFIFIFGLPIAWVVYAAAHGQKPFQSPPPAFAAHPTR